MSDGYTVDDVFSHNSLDVFPRGSSVLISGPAHIGKRSILLSILARAEWAAEKSLLVITRGNIHEYVQEYATLAKGRGTESLSVIDASLGQNPEAVELLAPEQIVTVGTPTNLTGIGIKIAEYFQHTSADVSGIRIGFDQITTLLRYLGPEQVSRFIDVLIGRFSAAGYLSVFTIDSDAHDPQIVSLVGYEFDVHIELRRKGDQQREYRVGGIPEIPENWNIL